MKRSAILIPLLCLAIVYTSHAQYGFGTDTPHPSAVIDATGTDKGILIPRVALSSTSIDSPVTDPALSLLVYNTATDNDVFPGYYFWDGTKWVRIADTNLAEGMIWIGDVNGIAQPQTMTGDVTMTSDGFTSIGSGRVTNDMLEGNITDDKLNELYALLSGRPGGQTLHGGTAANDALVLEGNSATGGNQPDNVNIRFRVGNSSTTAMSILNNSNIGIGTVNPASKLSVGPNSEFQVDASGNIVKINNVATSWPSSQGLTGTYLNNDGSGTLSWTASGLVPTLTEGSVLFSNGTTIAEDNEYFYYDITNHSLGIGTNTFDATNPEMLKVDAGVTESKNVISGYGNVDSYLQLNIQNMNDGGSATSDIVATSDNGGENNGFVDMGITSSGYYDPAYDLYGPDDAYLYSMASEDGTGGNLIIGTGSENEALIFHTSGLTSVNERMRIDGQGKVGIGITNPVSLLSVGAGSGFQVNTTGNILKINDVTMSWPASQGASNTFLKNNGSGTLSWASGGLVPSLSAGSVLFSNGTSIAEDNNYFFYDATNHNLAIGTKTFDTFNPEKLLVDAGITESVNAIHARGTINNYFQMDIQNQSNGTSASSNFVATADNGTETANFINVGINSSTFEVVGTIRIGGANDCFLLGAGNDLYLSNNNPTKDIIFSTGKTEPPYFNERMRIKNNGNIGIGTTTTPQILTVNGNVQATGAVLTGVADEGVISTKILTLNSLNVVTYRTPAEIRSDIGAAGTSHTHIMSNITNWSDTAAVFMRMARYDTDNDGKVEEAGKVTNALTFGVGLTSGGTYDGSAARTVSLGTPSTLTGTTTNGASGSTHTHAITTAQVTDGSTDLVNGGQVYTFVTGQGYGPGTVTSVGLSMPGQFTVTNSPVISSGTLTAEWSNQAINTVLAGPITGENAAPTFRALVSDDLPSHIQPWSSISGTPTTISGYGITDAYTQTQLQSSGQASVHWDNLTNKPVIGDMLKSDYDINNNNKVDDADNAEKVTYSLTRGWGIKNFTYNGSSSQTVALDTSLITLNALGNVHVPSPPDGSRLTYITASGKWEARPAFTGTVSSVAAGAGMNFSTITTTGSVVLGTPSTLSASTTNQATGTTHYHEISTAAPANGNVTDLTTSGGVFSFVDGGYISVIGTPTAGNFPVMTSGGELQNSTYSPSSFADAVHNHDHNTLINYDPNRHFLQSEITTVSTGIGNGLVVANGGALSTTDNNSGNWDLAYTHISNNGTDHSYINQDIKTTASPSFLDMSLTGVADEGVAATKIVTINSTNVIKYRTPAEIRSDIGAAASSHSHAWSDITSGTPTTLLGYGITDAYTKSNMQTSGEAQLHWNNITNKPTIGDMLKSIYDVANNGKVDNADNAVNAGKVTNALTQAWGIKTFTYNGSSAQSIALDTADILLNNLGNVHVPNPTSGQILTYSGTTWVALSPGGSGVGDMLKSVYDTDNDGVVESADKVTNALSDGWGINAFTYDGSSAASVILDTNDIKLNDLADVQVPNPSNGEVLTYSTSTNQWKAVAPGASGGGIGTVTSVAAGAGMNFTTITTSGSVDMGTPSTLDATTTNQATGVTHYHAITTAAPANGNTSALTTSDGVYDFVDGGYISLIGTPTTGNFPTITAGGEIQNSTYGPASFAASVHNHAWSDITSGTPTTLTGYGITDAYTKTELGAAGSASYVNWDKVFNKPALGTVSSVGLAMPTQFTVTNSPVTGSGTLTAAWNNQTANTVFAGPTSGGAAAPVFRSLVNADMPSGVMMKSVYDTDADSKVESADNADKVTNALSQGWGVKTFSYNGSAVQSVALDTAAIKLNDLGNVHVPAPSNGQLLVYSQSNSRWEANSPTIIDHGSLSGLADDDHTQYALLAGRTGGQTLKGGTSADNTLILQGNAASGGNTPTSTNIQFKVGNSGATTAMTLLNNGNVGIGAISPASILSVGSNSEFQVSLTGNIVKINNVATSWPSSQGSAGTYLKNNGSGILSWTSDGLVPALTDGSVLFSNGSTIAEDNEYFYYDITNHRLGIGTNTFDAINPEMLKVDAGVTESKNVISGYGNVDSYLQLNIQNMNDGENASSDIVASADNSTESNAYVDLGINSSGYNDPAYSITGPNDSYLFSMASEGGAGGNLIIGTGSEDKALIFHTSGTTANKERMRIDGEGRVGVGTSSPASLLSVGSGSEFQVNTSGNIVKINNVTTSWPSSQGGANTFLKNNGSGNLSWASGGLVPTLTAGSVLFSDGTTIAQDNNNFYYDATNKNLAIGTKTFNVSNPEKLLVDAGTTGSVNAIYAKGTIDSYLQINIQNLSNGINASSDIVATANNGTENTNYMNIGINSSGYTFSGTQHLGGPNDCYVLGSGNDLYIANGNTGKDIIFSTGRATAPYYDERMRIKVNGYIGIGTTTTPQILTVNGNVQATGAVLTGVTDEGVTSTKILTLNSSNGVSYRTPAEIRSDIGAAGTSHTHIMSNITNWSDTAAAFMRKARYDTDNDGKVEEADMVTNALTFGAGLSAAGTYDGSTARTVTLGTPSTLTGTTTNSATGTTHTHAITTAAVTNGSTNLVNGGQVYTFVTGQGYGLGTVTSVGLSMPAQFTVTNSPVISSGTLTASWNNQAQNTVLAGPASGVNAAPTFRALVAADIPSHTQAWSSITGTPTTIAGYGITDAYTKTQLQTSGQSSVHWDNITNKPVIGDMLKSTYDIGNNGKADDADNAQKVTNALTMGWGIKNFSYNGSSAQTVTVDTGVIMLNNLGNVHVPAPSNGQVLTYSTANTRWEAQSPATATSYWTLTGNDIYNNNNSGNGNVGIGYSSGLTGAKLAVNGNVGIGATNATQRLYVYGGNLGVSTDGSTTTDPRVVGMLDFSTGEAARFQFGDAWNSWQNAYDQRMQITAYWGIELTGSRQTAAGFPFVAGTSTDASVTVLSGNASRKVFVVKGEASQTANLIEWQNNAGTALGVINSGGNVGIGNSTPNSTLDVEGSLSMSIITVTTSYTATASDFTILCNPATGITLTVSLPAAASVTGRVYVIKKIAANSTNPVLIDPNGAETIEGSATPISMAIQYTSNMIQSNGTSWFVLSNK